MTNDYIKYFNVCRCRSCRYFMLMDPWTGDAICGLCYKVGVDKDIWGEDHVCKAFVLDDSFRPFFDEYPEALYEDSSSLR